MTSFLEKYNNYLDIINNYLENCIKETLFPENRVVEAMKYSVLSGGKRIRSIFLMAFCEAFGDNIKNTLDVAAAIEMIHSYSLIHDDLPCMDNDDFRRGKPSCHIKFGEDIAILAGDALLTESFYRISNSKYTNFQKIEIIKLLSYNIGYMGMIGGQVIDIDSENKNIDFETLKRMHVKKTSYLISASCEIASIISNNENRTLCKNFGEKLGLCFQILDDILDVNGDEKKIGKPIKSDIEKNKVTYVNFFGIDKSYEIARDLSNECINMLKSDLECQFLIDMVEYLLNRQF